MLSGVRLRERGRRAVGIWPNGESVDALVDALRQAGEATTDPEEKTLIRRPAGALTSARATSWSMSSPPLQLANPGWADEGARTCPS